MVKDLQSLLFGGFTQMKPSEKSAPTTWSKLSIPPYPFLHLSSLVLLVVFFLLSIYHCLTYTYILLIYHVYYLLHPQACKHHEGGVLVCFVHVLPLASKTVLMIQDVLKKHL